MEWNTTVNKVTCHDMIPMQGKAKTGAPSPKKHKKC